MNLFSWIVFATWIMLCWSHYRRGLRIAQLEHDLALCKLDLQGWHDEEPR